MHKNKKIYKPEESTGSDIDRYRDCIDIAVKLAFGFAIKGVNSVSNLEDLLVSEPVRFISNQVGIDNSLLLDSLRLRIKQNSDFNLVSSFHQLQDSLFLLKNLILSMEKNGRTVSFSQYQANIEEWDSSGSLDMKKLLDMHMELSDLLIDKISAIKKSISTNLSGSATSGAGFGSGEIVHAFPESTDLPQDRMACDGLLGNTE